MTGDLIVQILLGLLVLVVGFTGYVTASRATRSQAQAAGKGVDAGAFERAREIYEGALTTLRDELTATRSDLIGARNDLLAARAEITGMRDDSRTLRQEIARLRTEITRLGPASPDADPA